MDEFGWVEVCCPRRDPHRAHVWWEGCRDLKIGDQGYRCEGLHACDICHVLSAFGWMRYDSGPQICIPCKAIHAGTVKESQLIVEWADKHLDITLEEWQKDFTTNMLIERRLEVQTQRVAKQGGLIPWLYN